MYYSRYGEEDGERRFAEWQAKSLSTEEAPTQGGPATGEAVPRRRSSKKPTAKDVYEATGAAIYGADQVGAWVFPTWAAMRLNDEEIGRLARASGDEVLNSEKLTKWLMQAQKSGVHVKFALAVGSVALPRLIALGYLPNPAGAPGNAAADVEGGRAHGDRGDDGVRQVDPHGPFAGHETAFRRPQVQGGFGEVSERQNGDVSGRHARPSQPPFGTEATV
jgi:hypothetical protein